MLITLVFRRIYRLLNLEIYFSSDFLDFTHGIQNSANYSIASFREIIFHRNLSIAILSLFFTAVFYLHKIIVRDLLNKMAILVQFTYIWKRRYQSFCIYKINIGRRYLSLLKIGIL